MCKSNSPIHPIIFFDNSVNISFYTLLSFFHSPFYHALPTRSHIRSFSLSRSYRFRAPFSFSLPPYSFAKSQSTRQVTSMSATARFQAVEGNWLYSAARRSGQAFTHTPFAEITPRRGPSRNTLLCI